MSLLLSLKILFILKSVAVLGNHCYKFDTPGYTTPSNDIILREGKTLNINCTLRDISNNETSSRHLFWKSERNETDSKFIIKYITNKTAQLTVMNITSADSGLYKCMLNKSNEHMQDVCVNLVTVGFPPPEFDKINCIFQNWQTLNCTWKQDKLNKVRTNWIFRYFVNNRKVNCTNYLISKNGEYYGCIINDSSSLIVMQQIKIELEGSNVIKNVRKEYPLDLFKHVVFPPPNVTVQAHGNKAIIKWVVSLIKKLGVTCIISYKCTRNNCEEKYKKVSYFDEKRVNAQYNTTLSKLFWYSNYTVGVKCQLQQTNIPHKWSPQTTVTFSVESSVPERSPVFNVGSFMQILKKDVRNIIIYWESIAEREINSAQINYYLECGRMNFSIQNRNYIKIKGLNATSSYNFTLKACNENGCAPNPSYVYIPEVSAEYPQTDVYAVRYFTSQNANEVQYTYEISWKNVTLSHSLMYYSVFKCLVKYSELNGFHICKEPGLIKLNEVKGINSVTISFSETQEKYKFAIALHNNSHSGGLTWTTCQKEAGNEFQEIGEISLTQEDLTWALLTWDVPDNCILRSMTGYKIIYKNLGTQIEKNVKIDDVFSKYKNLTGLVPASHYKLTLFMLRNSIQNISRSFDFHTKSEKPGPSSFSGIAIIAGILGALCGLAFLSVIAVCLVQKVKSKIKELKNIQVPTGFREDSNFPLITTVTPSPPCEKLTNGSHSSGFGSDCPESTTSSPTMSFTCIHPTTDLDTPRIATTDIVFEYPSIDPLENYSLVGNIISPEMQTLDVSALQTLEREPDTAEDTIYYAKLSILPESELQETLEIGDENEVQSPPSLAKGYTSVTASDLMEPYVKLALNENTESKNFQQVNHDPSVFPSSLLERHKVLLLPSELGQESLTSGSSPGYITCKSLTGTLSDPYIRLSDQNQNLVNDVFSSNDYEFDEISLNEYFETSSNQSDDVNG